MKVIVIGGGIGGLCLANGLQKAGIDVQVFERQSNSVENLAGYGIHIDRNGRNALRNCLSLSDWTNIQNLFTTTGTRLFFRDTKFGLLALRDDAELSGRHACEVERSGIGRIELRDALLAGLDNQSCPIVHWNKAFRSYTHLKDGRVRVYFTDDSWQDGDLVVGADGSHSEIRRQYLPNIQRLDLGILAIAGRTMVTDELANSLPPEMTNGSLNNIVPYGKGWMFVSAWKSKPSACHSLKPDHYVLWAYVLPKTDAPADINEFTGADLSNIVLDAIDQWAPELRTLVRQTDLPSVKCIKIHSMPDLTPWKPSNITVMGDSIHNMTPMAGVGANTALRDAEVLTRVLIDAYSGRISLIEAVSIYEQEMRAYANDAVTMSRKNAKSACNGGSFQRVFLRGLLCAAHASPLIMRATFGRSLLK
ncbi:hypothetical protein QQS21_004361 [Conoideocrella luteorostrata]|uniref:FAD-binding domain-containing protein n=1 Tax=Conoideocrella luteorostrata TaxID=1105319 RepID=A0AAJ0CRE7_9HYPO|nr:hypothetical protein QQS21_004361 [Conoideocrella luteorostrata]